MKSKKRLGELLVRENLISMDQLEVARKEQKASGRSLPATLVQMGALKEVDLTNFLGKAYGLAAVDLTSFEVSEDVIGMLSKQVCLKHNVIPISKSGRTLVVAFSDPSDIYIKDDLSLLTRCKIEVVVAPESAIRDMIEKYYGQSTNFEGIMSEIGEDTDQFQEIAPEANVIDQDMSGTSAPVIKFVNAMLAEAIKLNASDIHVEPYEKRFRIRFRIDGVLEEKTQPPQGAAAAIVTRIKVISKLDIAERRRPQDGRLKVRLKNGKDVDFRVNCLPTLFGEKVVMRVLDKSNLQVDMGRLGLEKNDEEVFLKAIHQPQGMILITGPTGSGKTTTIYSAISELNKSDVNLSTAEDPVEFNLDGVNQVQINSEIGFGFPEALRAFLRQDPEVIVVGEIRDLETAQIAFKAASTGHMVISTLHTNDSCSTVTRLVDMGIAPFMVAESTSLVVAQRLIRRVCEHCAVPFEVPRETLIDIGVKESDLELFKETKIGEGCNHCNKKGLRGRLAIFEVLQLTSSVKRAICEGQSALAIKQQAIQSGGLRSLRQAALLKLRQGLTTVEEVINSSVDDYHD